MKAYKGFNKDLKCRGFQYKEGESYEHKEAVSLCRSGFHACEDPVDCFSYYAPGQSVYHEVELDGVSDERSNEDSKVVAKQIKVGVRLTLAQMIKACIDFRFSKTTIKPGAKTDEDHCSASATGDRGAASATGYSGAASATGDSGAASATGDRGAASATGYSGAASATGRAGVAVAAGHCCKAMGAIGCALFLVEREWNDDEELYNIVNVKAVIVDGKNIMPGVWYQLIDGEIREV